jgi:hypothetical protein
MKIQNCAWLVIAFAAGMSGCHRGPTAISADGDILKEGQTVYAKRAAIACNSQDELKQARDIAKGGDKGAFFAYLNGHCGAFDKSESVQILSIEGGGNDQVVVIKDLDDPSAPAQLWIDGKSLTLNK